MKLRKHQKSDYKQLKKELAKQDHILFGACTGYGKSAIIYKYVKDALKKGGRVVVIAPRRKLVKQLTETLSEFYPSVIMGSDTVYHKDSQVFVCSTPTLSSRLKKFGKKYLGNIDFVLVDEVHQNFGSASMQKVTDFYWDTAKWLGLSATPIDQNAYALEGYDHTVYNHQTQDLIDMGWLKDIKVMIEETPEGLEQVGLVGGDYNESELAEFMSDEARVSNIYEVWKKYAKKRKTMVFCVNIQHSNIVVEDFKSHNISVGIVHSKLGDVENNATLAAFDRGEIKVLVNVSQLTTGFDMSSVDAAIIARPSKSLRLWLQIIGRILRKHKGIKTALLLDVAGTVAQHGHPTQKRDFSRQRPPRGAGGEAIEFKDIECPHCGYATQRKNMRKVQIVTKLHTINRLYCPNCDEIVDEVVNDTKEIARMQLVKDITNVKKVSNNQVYKFVKKIREHKDYKPYWLEATGRKYTKHEHFKYELKLLYNKYKAKMINLDTCANTINKLSKEY